MEFVVVVRHVNRRVVELAVSEPGNDYEVLSELRSKGLDIKDDAGSYYVFDDRIRRRTYAGPCLCFQEHADVGSDLCQVAVGVARERLQTRETRVQVEQMDIRARPQPVHSIRVKPSFSFRSRFFLSYQVRTRKAPVK